MSQPITLITACLLLATGAGAQSIGPSTLNAAGGSAVVGGNTYEWSVGEMAVIGTYSAASLVVTQGVLQPVTTTGIAGHPIAQQQLQVYPSPVAQTLYLQPRFAHSGTLAYTLYDIAGRKILSGSAALMTGNEQQSLPVAALAAGQYTLQVEWLQGGQTFANAYKVQKIQ